MWPVSVCLWCLQSIACLGWPESSAKTWPIARDFATSKSSFAIFPLISSVFFFASASAAACIVLLRMSASACKDAALAFCSTAEYADRADDFESLLLDDREDREECFHDDEDILDECFSSRARCQEHVFFFNSNTARSIFFISKKDAPSPPASTKFK